MYIQQNNTATPTTHDLCFLQEKITHNLSEKHRPELVELNSFAIAARYTTPEWKDHVASKKNASIWIQKTENIYELLHS